MDVELIKQLKDRVIRHRITRTTELRIRKLKKIIRLKDLIFYFLKQSKRFN